MLVRYCETRQVNCHDRNLGVAFMAFHTDDDIISVLLHPLRVYAVDDTRAVT